LKKSNQKTFAPGGVGTTPSNVMPAKAGIHDFFTTRFFSAFI
jgi:hypothetical protein